VTKPPIRNGLTAASCVAFMTLLAKDRLVNRDACDRMRFLLNRMDNLDVNSQFYKPATLSSSPLGLGLTNGQDGAAYTPILKELSSKLGVGHGLTDCAFIERKSPPIKYAVACVYCSGTQQRRTLRHLAAALDRCVQECHS
jgi:hypothetical protein